MKYTVQTNPNPNLKMSGKFEIEIKSLLGEEVNALTLKDKLREKFPMMTLVGKGKQLNHYFIGDVSNLYDKVSAFFSDEQNKTLKKILTEGKSHSIRTRQTDEATLFVIKASIDDSTSSNGIKRMEFEEKVPLSLDELDQILLDAGLEYQAKWSREREEYKCEDVNVCLDKNAGYGWLAEFEKVLGDDGDAHGTEAMLRNLMVDLGVIELPQDRLERMFDFYNKNWRDYYGTENVFNIE